MIQECETCLFCIPSYQRCDIQITLDYLRSIGVDSERIYIFVQTEDDNDLYVKHNKGCRIVYAPAKSIPEARNNILRYFNGNETLIMMDDDVSGIVVGTKFDGMRDVKSAKCLYVLLDYALRLVSLTNARLFGFYPVCNTYFMSNTIDTKKPVNTIIGVPKGFAYHFDERFIAKEDIELCGRIICSGGSIVRMNNIAFKAKHRTNNGGANEVWMSGVNKEYASRLQGMYPNLYSIQKNNPEEIRTSNNGGKMKIRPLKDYAANIGVDWYD